MADGDRSRGRGRRRPGTGRRARWGLTVLAAVAAAAAACAPRWQVHDGACARTLSREPLQRVINYADPELCGRPVQERSPEAVRVPPPEPRE